MPSGWLSPSPARLALACALRFWRLARSCSASRTARSPLALEAGLSSLIVPLPCRLVGIGGPGACDPCLARGCADRRYEAHFVAGKWPWHGRYSKLALPGTIWQKRRTPRCCSSSVVEHSLGKGEVESSILSCSTSFPPKCTYHQLSPTGRAGWIRRRHVHLRFHPQEDVHGSGRRPGFQPSPGCRYWHECLEGKAAASLRRRVHACMGDDSSPETDGRLAL